MKTLLGALFISAFSLLTSSDGWITKDNKSFTIKFKKTDEANVGAYQKMISNGIIQVESFFGSKPKNKFTVVVHPHRQSLDSTWRADWKMPDFKSECWMVASGVATKLDMISPAHWSTEACEHNYSDVNKTQQLITHELVHVYHGQQNKSQDFSEAEGIDWFVEGLATYASGQCDERRMAEVTKLAAENFNLGLDKFWTGKNRYAISGSMVMYIDKYYGRTTLLQLLPFSKKSEILNTLNIDETTLISNWRKFLAESQ